MNHNIGGNRIYDSLDSMPYPPVPSLGLHRSRSGNGSKQTDGRNSINGKSRAYLFNMIYCIFQVRLLILPET
jgi:hypothetical protein